MTTFNISNSKIEQLNSTGNNYKLSAEGGNNAVTEAGDITQTTAGAARNPRLYVEDIENFARVREVSAASVSAYLKDGYVNLPEDTVQRALEEILAVPFHKVDCPNEYNDLYTANVLIGGTRKQTAFMLKGNGLRKNMMEIRDCGKNGDQVVRLFQSPAVLFVIQFVGNVSEAVINQAEGEVARLKTQSREAQFLIMDGQETARLMAAYGKLPAAVPLLPAAAPSS